MKLETFVRLSVLCTCSVLISACASKRSDVAEDQVYEETTVEEDLGPEPVEQDVLADEYVSPDAEALPGDQEMASAPAEPSQPGYMTRPGSVLSEPYDESRFPPPAGRTYPNYDVGYARSQASSGSAYTVQRGDSLWSISRRHGTTVRALADANGISPTSVLRIGQRLVIPAGTRAAAPATRASTTGGRTYTVQQGDTYSSIAQKYGISYKQLMEHNGAQTPLLRVGQVLSIP